MGRNDSFDVYIAYDRDAGADLPSVIQVLCCSYGYSAFHAGNLIEENRYDGCLHTIISQCKYFVLVLTDGMWEGRNSKHILWQLREAVKSKAKILVVRPTRCTAGFCLSKMTGSLAQIKDKCIVDLALQDDGEAVLSKMGISLNCSCAVVKSQTPIQEPRKFIEQYAEKGLASAECALGCMLYRASEKELAKQWLIRAAEHGDVVAMLNLGVYKFGFHSDERFADYWLRSAVSYGCAPAEYFLAFCVGNGWYDGAIDFLGQRHYIKESAKHGCGDAMCWLAMDSVDWNWAHWDRPKKWRFDLKRACYWWRRARIAGCFAASYYLAMVELGMYVPLQKNEWFWHEHEGFDEWRTVVLKAHPVKGNCEKSLKRAKKLLLEYIDCSGLRDLSRYHDACLYLARIAKIQEEQDEATSWYEKGKSSGWYVKGEEMLKQ